MSNIRILNRYGLCPCAILGSLLVEALCYKPEGRGISVAVVKLAISGCAFKTQAEHAEYVL
jgi:hypothetical protein